MPLCLFFGKGHTDIGSIHKSVREVTRFEQKAFISLPNRFRIKINVERVGKFIQAHVTWALRKKVIQLTNYILQILGVMLRGGCCQKSGCRESRQP